MRLPRSPAEQEHWKQEQHLSSTYSAKTFASRRHGKRGAPEFEFQRQWAPWGADKPSANLSPGSSPRTLTVQCPSGNRESCGAPCPKVVPALPLRPLTQVAPGGVGAGVGGKAEGWGKREGRDSPASPSQHPRCPPQRVAALASNFNPEEGANRSFAKLFQSDSDKQIAGSPGV